MDSDADSQGRPLRRLVPSVFLFCFFVVLLLLLFYIVVVAVFYCYIGCRRKNKKGIKTIRFVNNTGLVPCCVFDMFDYGVGETSCFFLSECLC